MNKKKAILKKQMNKMKRLPPIMPPPAPMMPPAAPMGAPMPPQGLGAQNPMQG